MQWSWVWQTLLVFFVGTLLLRIGGRKSISQMNLAQVVVMIGIGSLLIQPLTGQGLGVTFGVGLILVLAMVLTEYLETKVDWFESLVTGKGVPIVINGKIQEKQMKKMRISVDRLETRLRQNGIKSIDDVAYATLETNGQLGYSLKPAKQPATKEDLDNLKLWLAEQLHLPKPDAQLPSNDYPPLFVETQTKQHAKPVPKHLQ
ncbi:DUF421 domain-containing protein [Paenibacillus turpanensis]|uniref:DUF421 domain-containing protein n=1 Tax=Paenibacillus turpanensis TaxID=2689078 RepID=UPI00140E47A0|nr:YetF domain-containing protein [Paenibacillus turpanensis]